MPSSSRRNRKRRPTLETLERRDCPAGFFDLDLLARGNTGPNPMVGIGRNPSINDNGHVAFVAQSRNGNGQTVDNVHVWNAQTRATRALLNAAMLYPNTDADQLTPGTQSIFDGVQINNADLVLARRRLNASVLIGGLFGTIATAPLTFLETWNANATGTPAHRIATGLPAGASALLWTYLNPQSGPALPTGRDYGSPYEGLFKAATLNNLGQVNFSAIVAGAGNNRVSSNTAGDLVGRGGIGALAMTPVLADNGN